MPRRLCRVALLALVALVACKPRRPFCAQDLSGTWRHADDATYRFRAVDEGKVVTMEPFREGGGVAGQPPMRVALEAAPDKLAGWATTTAKTPLGKECTVRFQFDVVACETDRITVRSEQEYGMGEDCLRLPGQSPDIAENVLVRVK